MTSLALATLFALLPGQTQSTLCQIHATPGSYGTETISPTSPPESVSGFKFNVAAGPGGTLPLIKRDLAPGLHSGSPLTLYRKAGDGTYQKFCAWDMTVSPANSRGGLLLPTGQYLYPAAANSPLYANLALLGGEWLSADAQRDYYGMQISEPDYTTITIAGGQSFPGFRFLVKTREDAKYPIVTQATSDIVLNSGTVYLYKRVSRQIYSLSARFGQLATTPGHGLLISPGEYAIQVKDTTRPASFYAGSILLTGRYGSENP